MQGALVSEHPFHVCGMITTAIWQPIIDAAEPLQKANASFQQQVHDYDALSMPGISMIRSAYSKGETQLNDLANRVAALSNTFQILPTLLGNGQQRTYAVMASVHRSMSSKHSQTVGSNPEQCR